MLYIYERLNDCMGDDSMYIGNKTISGSLSLSIETKRAQYQ